MCSTRLWRSHADELGSCRNHLYTNTCIITYDIYLHIDLSSLFSQFASYLAIYLAIYQSIDQSINISTYHYNRPIYYIYIYIISTCFFTLEVRVFFWLCEAGAAVHQCMLQQEGHFYVCGSARQVPEDIYTAMKEAVGVARAQGIPWNPKESPRNPQGTQLGSSEKMGSY